MVLGKVLEKASLASSRQHDTEQRLDRKTEPGAERRLFEPPTVVSGNETFWVDGGFDFLEEACREGYGHR
jgi:2-hydroxychromene-2-carboxylate isomerase